MDATNTLNRIIYGKPSGSEKYDILGYSETINPQELMVWRSYVTLSPRNVTEDDGQASSLTQASQAVGIFRGPDHDFLLVRTHYQDGDSTRPIYEYVLLTWQDLQSFSGNIRTLIDLVDYPIPEFEESRVKITPLMIPAVPTWTIDKRMLALGALLSQHAGDHTRVLAILGAALDDRGLTIRNFKGSYTERVEFVQGLLLLLPVVARTELTFATHVDNPQNARARIIFVDTENDLDGDSDSKVSEQTYSVANYEDETLVSGATRQSMADVDNSTEADASSATPPATPPATTSAQTGDDIVQRRWVVDMNAHIYPDIDHVRSPYITCLESIWRDDGSSNGTSEFTKDFVVELRAIELMAAQFNPSQHNNRQILDLVAARYMQDKQVLSGESVPVDILKKAIEDDQFASDELRQTYIMRLFENVLEERDPEAELIIAHAMDSDESINNLIEAQITEALETHPDAVYAFARERLRESIDPRWLPRLHAAAVYSLQVAINDGDAETLINWLRLLAREPENFELDDVFEQGLLAAQERAHTDGNVGFQLIRLALRRAPDTVDNLLNDPDLLDALPDGVAHALVHFNQDAITSLQGRELFLVTLARALKANAHHVFTEKVIQQFWAIYIDDQKLNLPEQYRPETIIAQLMTDSFDWMSKTALDTLLTLMVVDKRDVEFNRMMPHVISHDLDMFASILNQSERTADDLLTLVGGAVTAGHLTQQQAVDTYLQILAEKTWREEYLPLAEHIARVLQQNASVILPTETIWQMLGNVSGSTSEVTARILSKRLFATIENLENEKKFVNELLKLHNEIAWSDTVYEQVLTWVREYVRDQPLVRLQQINQALLNNKPLQDVREIVETMIAMRKMMGKRSLEEFADEIGNAYRILQALSESFDPQSRQQINFDSEVVRIDLEKRQDELTPDERKVLAKNLRELGGLVVNMAEHRSKASLIRREGDIERGLISGDQQPHSAIDMMKWLSGYLDGAHGDDD